MVRDGVPSLAGDELGTPPTKKKSRWQSIYLLRNDESPGKDGITVIHSDETYRADGVWVRKLYQRAVRIKSLVFPLHRRAPELSNSYLSIHCSFAENKLEA